VMKQLLVLLTLAVLVAALPAAPVRAQPSTPSLNLSPLAPAIQDAIVSLDYEKAHALLAMIPIQDPALLMLHGVLDIYENRCLEAAETFARPELQAADDTPALLELARGCARVTALASLVKDETANVELTFQDPHDEALAPEIIRTVVRAREALTRDLGVTWPKPTRMTIVRDHLSLSAATGLPYAAAKTTGVVAIAKWGRVTLLSPRAPQGGYGWIDTIAHELTHLAVTRATFDRAPLWLQEGLAKTEEVRFRPASPFDDRPPVLQVVKRGIEKHLDLPFDGLGQSIALLPSAEQAAVAYAEVSHFTQMLMKQVGTPGMIAILSEIGKGHSVEAALKSVTQEDLKTWEGKWRAEVSKAPKENLSSLLGFGDSGNEKAMRALRVQLRLAELLVGRNKLSAASKVLDQVSALAAKEDPRVRTLRARIAERTERATSGDVLAALGDPYDALSSYGPCWAIQARTLQAQGKSAASAHAFDEGRNVDPLDVEVACEANESVAASVKSPAPLPLCEAARTRREPLLGQD
jgi:hypothetical protein